MRPFQTRLMPEGIIQPIRSDMKKIMIVSRCRRCGAEIRLEAAIQDQVRFEQNGYKWPRNGIMPLQVASPSFHQCSEDSMGVYGYAGFDIVEAD